MNGLGSPATSFAQSQRAFSPTNLGFNALAYIGPGNYDGTAVDVSAYGMWAVYISTTGAGNATVSIVVMEETVETNVLVAIPLTTVLVSPNVTVLTWGTPGCTAVLVPARLVKLRYQSAANGTVTARMFGRGF